MPINPANLTTFQNAWNTAAKDATTASSASQVAYAKDELDTLAQDAMGLGFDPAQTSHIFTDLMAQETAVGSDRDALMQAISSFTADFTQAAAAGSFPTVLSPPTSTASTGSTASTASTASTTSTASTGSTRSTTSTVSTGSTR